MRGKTVQEGSVIALTIAPRAVAVAKVIYVSTIFKDVVGLRMLNLLFDHLPRDLELPANPGYLEQVIYTGKQSIGREWPIIAVHHTSDDELQLTRRLVAGDVYVGDRNCGRASELDRKKLRSMAVAGMYAVHDELVRRLLISRR